MKYSLNLKGAQKYQIHRELSHLFFKSLAFFVFSNLLHENGSFRE